LWYDISVMDKKYKGKIFGNFTCYSCKGSGVDDEMTKYHIEKGKKARAGNYVPSSIEKSCGLDVEHYAKYGEDHKEPCDHCNGKGTSHFIQVIRPEHDYMFEVYRVNPKGSDRKKYKWNIEFSYLDEVKEEEDHCPVFHEERDGKKYVWCHVYMLDVWDGSLKSCVKKIWKNYLKEKDRRENREDKFLKNCK